MQQWILAKTSWSTRIHRIVVYSTHPNPQFAICNPQGKDNKMNQTHLSTPQGSRVGWDTSEEVRFNISWNVTKRCGSQIRKEFTALCSAFASLSTALSGRRTGIRSPSPTPCSHKTLFKMIHTGPPRLWIKAKWKKDWYLYVAWGVHPVFRTSYVVGCLV